MNREYRRTEARLVFLLGLAVLAVAATVSTAVDVRVHELLQRVTEAL
jgi:hypothetical protein